MDATPKKDRRVACLRAFKLLLRQWLIEGRPDAQTIAWVNHAPTCLKPCALKGSDRAVHHPRLNPVPHAVCGSFTKVTEEDSRRCDQLRPGERLGPKVRGRESRRLQHPVQVVAVGHLRSVRHAVPLCQCAAAAAGGAKAGGGISQRSDGHDVVLHRRRTVSDAADCPAGRDLSPLLAQSGPTRFSS
jgi:hypothetical protein